MSQALSERPLLVVDEPLPAPAEQRAVADVSVIRADDRWQIVKIKELWRYRELLYFIVWRDVKVRYKQTMLGAAWAILQPLLMMVVFTLFFRRMANAPSGDLPYPLFAYAGLLPWTFFSTAVAKAGQSVVGSEPLITKVYFPRLAIPFGSVGAAMVDLAIASALIIPMMLFYGVLPDSSVVALPVTIILVILAALGIGAGLAALNVAYRDFRYVVPFVLQLWMLATPTIYMAAEDLPKSGLLGWAAALNPMTGLVAAFRASLFGQPVDWWSLSGTAAFVVAVFVAGCLYFQNVEDSFADTI